jgi:hypothetical protein
VKVFDTQNEQQKVIQFCKALGQGKVKLQHYGVEINILSDEFITHILLFIEPGPVVTCNVEGY